MTTCHVDHAGFHHHAHQAQPECRCGLNFTTWPELDAHLTAASIGTTTHDIGELR